MREVFESVARYFALLSDPMRLRIMHTVCQAERSVGRIVEETGATQSNVSRHLGMLHRAGVLARRRKGAQVFYRVTDPAFTEICRIVCVRVASELAGDKSLQRGFNELIADLRQPVPAPVARVNPKSHVH
ncbi:MAG TPA: metalloregulator ArsR/SmtB family transcription factor [Caldimonas sp.]